VRRATLEPGIGEVMRLVPRLDNPKDLFGVLRGGGPVERAGAGRGKICLQSYADLEVF